MATKIIKLKYFAKLATGLSLYGVWSWILDNPLWIAVIGWLGLINGSILMTFVAIVNNFIFLVIYQKKENDWLGTNGLELMKEHGDKWARKVHEHRNFFIRTIFWVPALFFRLLVWAVRKNNALAFITLSIQTDSFITTAFLRGKVGGKLARKDYKVFIGSSALGCLYWSLRNGVILAILKGGCEVTKQFI